MSLNFFNLDKDKSTNNLHFDFISSFMKDLTDYWKNAKNEPLIEDGLYQIDRFEGDDKVFAVCQNLETQKMFYIPKSDLPEDALDCYVIKADQGIFSIDYDETKKYRKDI